MAKDGTLRGGRRVRSGYSKRSLVEQVERGDTSYVMDFGDLTADLDAPDMDAVDMDGYDLPKPSAYLSANQRDGKPFGADAAFTEVFRWLRERGCDKLVFPRLVEMYAEDLTRYVQCSEAISEYGMLGKHPTTGAPVSSPFVQMSLSYQKQANALWYEIWDIVKQNSMSAFEGDPQGDAMEAILRKRGG